MKNKKKILLFAKNIDTGTGTVVLNFGKLMNDFIIRTYFIERKRYRSDRDDKKVIYFSEKPIYRGYYSLNYKMFLEIVRQFFWFKNILIDEKPDMVISFNTHCNIIALLAHWLWVRNVKVVIVNENNVAAVFNYKLAFVLKPVVRYIGSFLFNKADQIICVSKGVARDYKKFFSIKKQVIVIYPGLKIKKTLKKAFNNHNKKLRIVSVGRFEPQKDFETLLYAFKELIKDGKKIELDLIGDGTKRNKLETLSRNLKINKYVHFLGWKENISLLLLNYDIFALSSYYEGLPLVILEAMAAGLPIISTDAPYGPAEILEEDKYGMLVPIGQSLALTEAMKDLIDNKKKRLNFARNALERSKYFSEEKMLTSYKKLIQSTLQ